MPVTVLSGFLGAGKTTLLQRVLSNTEGLKVAVIVNDMSAVNIDAKLVRNTELQPATVGGGEVHRIAEKLIEMQNGCVCCTLREDLLQAVASLAQDERFDYCLIESTGISDPLPVAETFTFENENGSSLSDVATLDTMVTVVDASAFLGELHRADALAERGLAAGDEDERTISELMVSQVEFANVLLVNKVDLVQPAALTELEALLKRLNPDAQLLRTERGNVDVRRIMGTGLFDFERAAEAPGWLKALNGDRLPETEVYGISSFVFRARRPFHPERILGFVNEHLPAVVRSKGFFWLATRHADMGVWSQAGGSFTAEAGGTWWASTPQEEWPEDPEERSYVEAEFDGEWGDRRQELVFIGCGMDEAALRTALQSALLTDEELALGPQQWQQQFADDLPQWDVVAAEDAAELAPAAAVRV